MRVAVFRLTRLRKSELRICCAHFWHCDEQTAWMDDGKLSISTRRYHSILHQIP